MSRDGGRESEVLRKPVRPRKLEVAGFEDEDFEEIACEEKESEEAKPPEVLRDPGAPTPREIEEHNVTHYLSDLGALIVLLGRPKIVLTRRGKIRARSRSPRSCSTTASWAVRMTQRHWLCKSREIGGRKCCSRMSYQEKGWYMSMGLQRWSAISRGWATRRSS